MVPDATDPCGRQMPAVELSAGVSAPRNFAWDEQNLAIATDAGFNIVERQSDAPAARLGAIEYSALILASLRRRGTVYGY